MADVACMHKRLWLLAAVPGLLSVPAVIAVPTGVHRAVIWVVLAVNCVASTAIATLRQPRERRPWGFVVGACILAVGTVIELIVYWLPPEHLLWQLELAVYPVAFVVMAAALNRIAARRVPAGDPEARVDTLIVLLGLTTILIVTVSLQTEITSLSRHIATIVTPLTMAPILAACIRLLITGANRLPATWLLTSAASLNLLASISMTADPTVTARSPVLVVWIGAFTLLALGFVHPSFRLLAAPAPPVARQWQLGRLTAIGLALLALPVTGLSTDMTPAQVFAAVASMSCVGLVLWRLARLLAERDAAEQELARRALHDPLTQLPNRAHLTAALESALDQARVGTPVGALFIDLDGFKAVNDCHGHAVGDELLVAVAGRLRHELRQGDTAGRLAGDEFVVVCVDATPEQIGEVAARLDAALAAPFALSCGELTIRGSIGSTVARPGDTPDTLLQRADESMYAAKAAQRRGSVTTATS